MFLRKTTLSLTAFLLIITSFCFALEVKDFTFTHLGIQEGMPSQRVYSSCQTIDGSIWWTTKRGVSRSNGAKIRNYSLDEGALFSSFAGRTIKIANVDGGVFTQSQLYAYDNSGRIFKYNYIQNRFDKVAEVAKLLNREVYEIVVNDAYVSENGIWLAMREGIYLLKDNELKAIKEGVYTTCFINAPTKGEIVVGTKDGLFTVKKDAKRGFATTLLSRQNAESGYYDAKGKRLWIGTFDDGLHIINLKGGTNSVSTAIPGIPHNPIRSITLYDDTMLIGIDGFGVYEISRNQPTEGKLLFDANEGVHGVLHGNGVYSVLVDSWKNILVGTYSGGIDIARPVGSTTAIFKHTPGNMQSLINDHVNCAMQISKDELAMGTDDGVSIFNSVTSTWKHSARKMVVLDICKTPDGKLLVATYGNGVCEIGADGQARQVYSVANGTLQDDHVYKLLYDKSGNLWMGCLSGKLAEKTANGINYYDINNVQAMIQLPDGRIAVGTAYGLFLVKSGNKKLEEIKYYPSHIHDASWYIFDLYATSKEELWIATDGGGIYIYNLKSGKCKQISTEQGLPSNSVCNIGKDNTGRLWLGTENGLAFVDPTKPEDVVNVSYCYGLEREYVRGAVVNLVNGDMLYGSVEGAVIINPRKIQKLDYTATLTILGARYSDTEDEDFNEKVNKSLENNCLNLDYGQRSFELFYESINLRNQFDIAYQYKIGEGEWSRLTTNQVLQFENMEPGDHKLIIRCVSKTSGTVLDEKVIDISIDQPWWNSWWMWCIYIILIALAFIGAWMVYNLHSRYMRLVVAEMNADEKNTDSSLTKTDRTEFNENENNDVNDDNSESDEDEEIETRKPLDPSFADSATKIILDNLSNPDFTIDDLCREMAMSRTLFYVKLKSYTGKSPQDFIRVIRLERAASMLRSGRSVTDVSALVGFDNPKYFSTVFKKYFGVSPSKFQ